MSSVEAAYADASLGENWSCGTPEPSRSGAVRAAFDRPDEAIVPNFSTSKHPGEGGDVLDRKFDWAFVRLTENVGIGIDARWIHRNWGPSSRSGFAHAVAPKEQPTDHMNPNLAFRHTHSSLARRGNHSLEFDALTPPMFTSPYSFQPPSFVTAPRPSFCLVLG
jgi:hypothetical protein